MTEDDWILLAVVGAVLFFLWKRKQQAGLVVGVPTSVGVPPPPPAPTGQAMTGAPLTGAALTAAKASGVSYRAVTANGTAGGVPFGAVAVDRTKAPPPEKAYAPRSSSTSSSATSKALNNSTLNKAEQYSIAGGVAAAKAFGIPPALSRPVAQYGNPIALGKDVVAGGKAVGNFFSSIF